MKFDFKRKQYIGCIPVEACPEQPKDQSPCIVWNCRACRKPMWVSKKKRDLQITRPDMEIYCIKCIHDAAIKEVYEVGIEDVYSL
jgi:hypothetical protein